ncbi:MAG: hypothetical protein ACE5OQ_13985 [Woeseia sp.]
MTDDGVQLRTGHTVLGDVMTSDSDRRGKLQKLVLWSAALLVTLLAFYVLNHVVMSMQGLPLAWDLTPLE